MIASVINWVGTLVGAICVWAVWAGAGAADGFRWVIQGILLAAWDKIQREFFTWCGDWCVRAAWYLTGGLAFLFGLLLLGLLVAAWVFIRVVLLPIVRAAYRGCRTVCQTFRYLLGIGPWSGPDALEWWGPAGANALTDYWLRAPFK